MTGERPRATLPALLAAALFCAAGCRSAPWTPTLMDARHPEPVIAALTAGDVEAIRKAVIAFYLEAASTHSGLAPTFVRELEAGEVVVAHPEIGTRIGSWEFVVADGEWINTGEPLGEVDGYRGLFLMRHPPRHQAPKVWIGVDLAETDGVWSVLRDRVALEERW